MRLWWYVTISFLVGGMLLLVFGGYMIGKPEAIILIIAGFVIICIALSGIYDMYIKKGKNND